MSDINKTKCDNLLKETRRNRNVDVAQLRTAFYNNVLHPQLHCLLEMYTHSDVDAGNMLKKQVGTRATGD